MGHFQQKPCVFILGMHRSGTSCLTGMLKGYGLYLGHVSSHDRYNFKGNQEGYAVAINEVLLKANGGSWYDPVTVARISWKEQLVIERLRLQMTFDLIRNGKKKWGTKDPRMLFCWPAWEEKDIQFVGTFRHPLKVALSLRARSGGAAPTDWMELWYQYNLNLVELYEKNSFPIVNFDWEPQRYSRAVRYIARQLDLSMCGEEDFFDDKLRHQREGGRIESERHRLLYDRLIAISEKEERRLETAHGRK